MAYDLFWVDETEALLPFRSNAPIPPDPSDPEFLDSFPSGWVLVTIDADVIPDEEFADSAPSAWVIATIDPLVVPTRQVFIGTDTQDVWGSTFFKISPTGIPFYDPLGTTPGDPARLDADDVGLYLERI